MNKKENEGMHMIWKIVGNVKFFLDKCKRDNINAFAAQSAFFIILSSIPFLMVFSSLLKYTPVSESMILNMVKNTMPDYIAPFITSIINEVYNKSVGIVSLAAILAVWSAAKGVQYMANGLNVINDILETRNWIILRLWAVGYTVVFVLAIVITMVLLVFGKALKNFVIQYVPILENATNHVMGMRSLIMLVLLSLFFAVAFKTLPNRSVSFRSQLPGAILCSVAWYAFSFGLSIYVAYFNGFSMYGSLTTIVLIMLWLYFCMYIMMMCAEINVIFEDAFEKWLRSRKKSQKRVDV
jgi:membrane protein